MRRALPWLLACGAASCAPEAVAPVARLHLVDATAASGVDLVLTSGRRPATQILEVKGGGLALFDWDGDGDLDLFAPNGATLDAPAHGPGARLFENLGGLRFRDATTDAALDLHRWGYGCAVGDVDGDGDEDVFVACYGRDALLRNDGGRLVDVTTSAGLDGEAWSSAAAFGDVDRDGDLDLYVARFVRFDAAAPPPSMTFLGAEVFAGPMGLAAERDSLYLNRGDGTFEDASAALGIDAVAPAYGLGVAILDFDGDGWPEVFVGNDSGRNFLFHRAGPGPFEDRGVASGIATNQDGGEQATMGIAIGDVDGDGRADVFTSNFMDDTNTLHVNLGRLLFEDRGVSYGLGVESRSYLGWAAHFADLDLDGDEDLVVFNGHVYPPEITEPRGWRHLQEPLCYERDGTRFRRVTAESGGAWLAEAHCDRSAVCGDLDRDGDLDLVVAELGGPLRVLENDGARGAWLEVALDDPGHANRRGLGARVQLDAGGRRQVRWLTGGCGYQSANPPEAHFGLGDVAGPVALEVTWPDGAVQRVADVAPNRRVRITRE
ncbi:MAG: CRTAC1 family protein [Planctomycetes bacterium]|nr:CRTAC1 family protein [Planctomycetota bacterium]